MEGGNSMKLIKKNPSMASFANSEQTKDTNATDREHIIHSLFQNKLQITTKKIRSISCSSIIKALAIRNLVNKIPDSARTEKTIKKPFENKNGLCFISTLPSSDELNKKYLQLKKHNPNEFLSKSSKKFKNSHRKSQSSIFSSNFKPICFESKLIKDNNFPKYSKNNSPVSKLNLVSGFLSPSRSNPSKTSFDNESKFSQNKRKTSICKKANRQYVLFKNNEKNQPSSNEIDFLTPMKLDIKQIDLKEKEGLIYKNLILFFK